MSGFLGVLAAQGVLTALVMPGYNGLSYLASTANQAVQVNLKLSPDGTWAIAKGTFGTLTGTPVTGTWASGTLFAGGYECRVTPSGIITTGGGGVTPSLATGWVTISTIGQQFAVCVSSTTGDEGKATFSVDIREIGGNGFIKTSTVTLDATA